MADLAAELGAAAVRLRRAGDGLERDLSRAMKDAADGVPDAVRAGLAAHLPDSYAGDLARGLALRVGARLGGTEPKVTVTATSNRELRRLDAGRLTHPLYGNRKHWYTQAVVPGWFTGPCEDAAPAVRAAIERALENVSEEAVR